MSEKTIPQTTLTQDPKEIVYVTTYKKGYMIGSYHWKFSGPLLDAVVVAKTQLEKRHLKHLHTTPFLIDLNEDNSGPAGYGSEFS